jgi:hypothetical protein
MNCLDYTIPIFKIDSYQLPNMLQCIFHTILFHRMIYKVVKPKEILCSAFDSLSYISIDDPVLHDIVQTMIDSLIKKMDIHTTHIQQTFHFTLGFYKPIKRMWPFQDEQLYYEKWKLSISIYSMYDKSITRETKENYTYHSYQELLSILLNAPVPPPYIDTLQYLFFNIIDSEQKNFIHEFIDMIKSGPPRIL